MTFYRSVVRIGSSLDEVEFTLVNSVSLLVVFVALGAWELGLVIGAITACLDTTRFSESGVVPKFGLLRPYGGVPWRDITRVIVRPGFPAAMVDVRVGRRGYALLGTASWSRQAACRVVLDRFDLSACGNIDIVVPKGVDVSDLVRCAGGLGIEVVTR